MLNLLSSPPGRKFSKKEADLHFLLRALNSEKKKKTSLSLGEGGGTEIATPFFFLTPAARLHARGASLQTGLRGPGAFPAPDTKTLQE